MVQNLCFRNVQKFVAFLTYSIVQVSVLAYYKPLVKPPNFQN